MTDSKNLPDALLRDLEGLVRETFMLWDERRVGFSWRHYYFNHTIRVRNLGLTLARREGANAALVAVAATLHDLTKRYDGNMVTDAEGKRVVDANGYWRNERLPPARQNEVTRLYDRLNLAGQMHHLSGAALAQALLTGRGVSADFARDVADVIRAHVKGDGGENAHLYERPECCVLHDADMADANLGLVAFFRNIGIHTHRHFERTGSLDLEAYLDYLPSWVGTKWSFLDRMLTESGRELGLARQERTRTWVARATDERSHWEASRRCGLLGTIEYCMSSHEDPNLTAQLEGLRATWLPQREQDLAAEGGGSELERGRLALAKEFIDLLAREVAGEL